MGKISAVYCQIYIFTVKFSMSCPIPWDCVLLGTVGCLFSRATDFAKGLKRKFKETIYTNLH